MDWEFAQNAVVLDAAHKIWDQSQDLALALSAFSDLPRPLLIWSQGLGGAHKSVWWGMSS